VSAGYRTATDERKTLMNKRLPGEAVLRDGLASEEATTRAINAEPWEPLPGMVRQQCPECRYFFAAPIAGETLLCPDCASEGTRTAA
jgi:hypothetical protein